MGALYDFSVPMSDATTASQSSTSGIGGSFLGGTLNKGFTWQMVALIVAGAVLILLVMKGRK